LQGLQEDFFRAEYTGVGLSPNSGIVWGIALNVTNAFSGGIAFANGNNVTAWAAGSHQAQLLGWNYMQAAESAWTGTATFYGIASSSTYVQTGTNYYGRF